MSVMAPADQFPPGTRVRFPVMRGDRPGTDVGTVVPALLRMRHWCKVRVAHGTIIEVAARDLTIEETS